jgi:hypothetical protein
MKYVGLISESLEDLGQIQRKQKLVQFEKRVRFLILLKSGAAKTQKEAGSKVGWQLRQSQKIWQSLPGTRCKRSPGKRRPARFRETFERRDKSAKRIFTGIRSAEFGRNSAVFKSILWCRIHDWRLE